MISWSIFKRQPRQSTASAFSSQRGCAASAVAPKFTGQRVDCFVTQEGSLIKCKYSRPFWRRHSGKGERADNKNTGMRFCALVSVSASICAFETNSKQAFGGRCLCSRRSPRCSSEALLSLLRHTDDTANKTVSSVSVSYSERASRTARKCTKSSVTGDVWHRFFMCRKVNSYICTFASFLPVRGTMLGWDLWKEALWVLRGKFMLNLCKSPARNPENITIDLLCSFQEKWHHL